MHLNPSRSRPLIRIHLGTEPCRFSLADHMTRQTALDLPWTRCCYNFTWPPTLIMPLDFLP
jgi:hypothetical protein